MSSTESYQGISGFPDAFKFLGGYKFFDVFPLQMAIYLLLLVIAFILLNKSKYGRKVILSGTNPRAAEYSGINTRLTIMPTCRLFLIMQPREAFTSSVGSTSSSATGFV